MCLQLFERDYFPLFVDSVKADLGIDMEESCSASKFRFLWDCFGGLGVHSLVVNQVCIKCSVCLLSCIYCSVDLGF